MRDIEKKAMALLNASEKKMGLYKTKKPPYELPSYVALYLSIEQHEAFKQEVSDIVEAYVNATSVDDWEKLKTLIIPKPKPDPLVEIMKAAGWANTVITSCAPAFRTALDALGLEIREKGQ
jgi:hypothetical protein